MKAILFLLWCHLGKSIIATRFRNLTYNSFQIYLIAILGTIASTRAGYIADPSSFYGEPQLETQRSHPTRYPPPAPVGQDGNVIDTPEVAQAKAAHFAEFAKAAARAAEDRKNQKFRNYDDPSNSRPILSQSYDSYRRPSNVQQTSSPPIYGQQSYQQSQQQSFPYQNNPPLSAFQSRYDQSHTPVNPPSNNYQRTTQYEQTRPSFVNRKYDDYGKVTTTTTFVPAPLAEDGTVLDTPEVAALKAARLAELADAEARAYKYGGALAAAREFPGSQGQG